MIGRDREKGGRNEKERVANLTHPYVRCQSFVRSSRTTAAETIRTWSSVQSRCIILFVSRTAETERMSTQLLHTSTVERWRMRVFDNDSAAIVAATATDADPDPDALSLLLHTIYMLYCVKSFFLFLQYSDSLLSSSLSLSLSHSLSLVIILLFLLLRD